GNVQVSTLDLVNTIAEVSNLNKKDYTNESWTALEGKVLEAKAIFTKLNATEEEVNKAKEDIENAIKDLVVSKGNNGGTNNGGTNNGGTNNGGSNNGGSNNGGTNNGGNNNGGSNNGGTNNGGTNNGRRNNSGNN
ncbi:MAG: FIVAR domain-containing protein, partial [Clostridium sp.]|nr:FIVAR domain-containing protein [Clostridium sp.]